MLLISSFLTTNLKPNVKVANYLGKLSCSNNCWAGETFTDSSRPGLELACPSSQMHTNQYTCLQKSVWDLKWMGYQLLYFNKLYCNTQISTDYPLNASWTVHWSPNWSVENWTIATWSIDTGEEGNVSKTKKLHRYA